METIERQVAREVRRLRSGKWMVTRYTVSRLYGGPEEGGWWYDWYELDEKEPKSLGPFDWETAIKERDALNEPLRPAQRFSVLGGPDNLWVLERERGDSVSRERPRYE